MAGERQCSGSALVERTHALAHRGDTVLSLKARSESSFASNGAPRGCHHVGTPQRLFILRLLHRLWSQFFRRRHVIQLGKVGAIRVWACVHCALISGIGVMVEVPAAHVSVRGGNLIVPPAGLSPHPVDGTIVASTRIVGDPCERGAAVVAVDPIDADDVPAASTGPGAAAIGTRVGRAIGRAPIPTRHGSEHPPGGWLSFTVSRSAMRRLRATSSGRLFHHRLR